MSNINKAVVMCSNFFIIIILDISYYTLITLD